MGYINVTKKYTFPHKKCNEMIIKINFTIGWTLHLLIPTRRLVSTKNSGARGGNFGFILVIFKIIITFLIFQPM